MSYREARDHHDTIHEVVAEQLAQRKWELLASKELEEQVREVLEVGLSSSPANAVLFCYSRALYEACAGFQGRAQQEIAFRELFRFLSDMTHRYAPDLSAGEREELANYTNAELYYRLAGLAGIRGWVVREPGAFLAVATQQLRNAIRSWRRHFLSASTLLTDDHQIPASLEPEQLSAAHELESRVRICFERMLQRHPRARMQLAVVWQRHMHGEDYPALAARHGIAIPNARVLYARGIDKLRHDPDWRILAHDLGLIQESDTEELLK